MSSHKGNVRKSCYWGSLYSGWKMIFYKGEIVRFDWKKAVNLLLTTTMFHKNQNQTTEDAPFVSHAACIKYRLSLYFFQEIIPFYKKFHIFWNLHTYTKNMTWEKAQWAQLNVHTKINDHPHRPHLKFTLNKCTINKTKKFKQKLT